MKSKPRQRYTHEFKARVIGELWEEMSGGKCLFVMVTNKDWKPIS